MAHSTIVRNPKNKPIGLLCINVDMDAPMQAFLKAMLPQQHSECCVGASTPMNKTDSNDKKGRNKKRTAPPKAFLDLVLTNCRGDLIDIINLGYHSTCDHVAMLLSLATSCNTPTPNTRCVAEAALPLKMPASVHPYPRWYTLRQLFRCFYMP